VKTENTSACATVNCKVCRSAIALKLPVVPSCECIRCNKANHPIQNTSYKSHTNPYTWQYFGCIWCLLNLVFFFFSFLGWGMSDANWPIEPTPDDRWWWMWSSRWNENWQGKPKNSEKTCSSTTLSTTNPTRSDLGSNPGRRCEKPETNFLSYGTAFIESVDGKYWGMTVHITLGINGFLDFVHHPVF
jgi:hypothetical protein